MPETPAAAVAYLVHDDIAVLSIDNPPVNALGLTVRQQLVETLSRAQSDEQVVGIVICGTGGKFPAGADIREFGKPRQGPFLDEIHRLMEGGHKPCVAAIDGAALGGGLELALGAHFRLATTRAKLGFPEINLGLLPGASGTQRAPRVMGVEQALDLMLSGRQISASEALDAGLVDQVVEDDVVEAAVQMARSKATSGEALPLTRDRTDRIAGFDVVNLTRMREKNAAKWRGNVAPFKIIDCVEAAVTLPFDEGIAFEKQAFQACMAAPARAALVHLFFAERAAGKIASAVKSIAPAPIARVGVIGAGTMGGGIAMALANAGVPVSLNDASDEALERGLARIRGTYETSLSRGSSTREKVDRALTLIRPAAKFSDFADHDLVIEAAFEEIGVKQDIFARLDAVMKPGAILATNTSALDIDAIAAATTRPQDVVGLHFFSPANVMRLLEVVKGAQTSDGVLAMAMNFARRIGKIAVLSGNCPGFIGNRILRVYGREADILLTQGALPWEIDAALKDFGFPMGLYLMRDMAGFDVAWRLRKAGAPGYASGLETTLADRLCEAGLYGQKTGRGYYFYEGRDARPDPSVETMLEAISAEAGIVRRSFSKEEIVDRILCAMVNEGAKIVGEGMAQRASDIDIAYTYGYGFPKHHGGPMFWAQTKGLDVVRDLVRGYHAQEGERWTPAPLLERLADADRTWPA